MKPDKDSPAPPICAIGASAGGIEALQQFFAVIPDDLGLAYVVILHLAPDRKSELPGILARSTDMSVAQVGDHDKVKLEADHVYVIAPDRKLVIADSSIGAAQFDQPRGQRMAIDLFFRSLAETHGDGFAVVLSGSGSDGAVGAKAVKERGGLVLVQDPSEAAHGAMPRAVIATGIADVVLPVRELAARLIELARNKHRMRALLETPEPVSDDEEKAFRKVLEILRRQTRHDFSRYKRNTVMRRLARRMQLADQVTIADYLEYLRAHADEVAALFDDLLISVTTFFRDSSAWSALQTEVIGPLLERCGAEQQLRIWVPGCSTGEEAYTVAILVQEELERRKLAANIIIFASDADESSLAVAREGVYSAAISADVSEARLERFFRREDDHYRVIGELRDRLVFAAHNVLRDPPFSRLHLISCRNLLIYLDRDLQQQLTEIFRYALREDGYLFLGASETADEEMFRAINKRYRIFSALPGVRPELPEILAAPTPRPARHGREVESARRSHAPEIHLEVLERSAPPSVLIDERWNVVHLSPSAARYLQQSGGPPARRITDLVRAELRDELHALLSRAMEHSEAQLSEFIPVALNGAAHHVAMLAQRHAPAEPEGEGGSPRNGTTHLLVSFLDRGALPAEASPASPEPSSELVRELRKSLRQAERRIETMRDEHHVINEDLRAANEELQSLNEELLTVNNELKLKLEDVSRAHSDLENLLASTDLGTLFLDRELRIKRFTPRVAELFSIKFRDIDRPIGDINHSLDYPGFEQDLRQVLASPAGLEREAMSRAGQSFIVRISPYRLVQSEVVDGVVATFVDVTAIKAAQAALMESEQRLAEELQTMRRLHEMTMAAAIAPNTQNALDQLLSGAIELQQADLGNVQLLEGDSGRLRIVSSQGFGLPFLERFRVVHADDPTSCGRALRSRATVQIPDVTQDEEYAPLRNVAAEAGYRAVQSTPLISRSGVLVGILSVHFREPHAFVERDKQLGDLLGQQAAGLITSRIQQDHVAELNEELKQRTAELELSQKRLARQAADLLEQDRNRDEFLAALGHELRNPMAAIHSSIAVLSTADPTSQRALEILRRQERHMLRLINDLLDITRVKHGRIHLERVAVDLREVAQGALETVRSQASDKGLRLEYVPPGEPLYVDADPERLAQIFDNLLRNAVTYTDAGSVSLLLEADPSFGRVTVRDTGIGIDRGEGEALFKPYQRHPTDQRSGGLGLGLALVKALVAAHGGTVSYTSAGRGMGAAFSFTLPRVQAAAVKIPATRTPAQLPRRRVLVVDDQKDVADTLGEVLKSLGQDVTVVYDGGTAAEVARTQRPEFAFIDLSMPGMDGVELAKRLRQMYPDDNLALVAITGDPQAIAATNGTEFTHHLLKPATREDLVGVLCPA